MDSRAGTAYVDIRADFGELNRQLAEKFSRDAATGTVTVKGDFSQLDRQLAAHRAGFRGLGAALSREFGQGSAGARGFNQALRDIKRQVRTEILVDTSKAYAALTPLKQRIADVSADIARRKEYDLDTGAAQAKLQLLSAEAKRVDAQMAAADASTAATIAASQAATPPAGGGGGGGLGSFLGSLFGGGGGRGRGRGVIRAGLFGIPTAGLAASAIGLGPEHLLGTAAAIGGSAAGAAAGAGVLGAGALGTMAVGGGSDMAVMKSTIADTKTLFKNYTALTAAVDQYGAGSAKAVAAQAKLDQAMAELGPAAGAELNLAKQVDQLNTLWDKATAGARVQAVKILSGVVDVATHFVPMVAAAADRNFKIIDQALQPLFGFLKGPQMTKIWDDLEARFAHNLPYAVGAFTNAFELFAKVADIASAHLGGFTRYWDRLFSKYNHEAADQLTGQVDKLIGKFDLWKTFVEAIGRDLLLLFHASSGEGDTLIGKLTEILHKWGEWEASARGQEFLHTFFHNRFQELLAIANLLGSVVHVFGLFYVAVQPLVPVVTAVAHALADALNAVVGLGHHSGLFNDMFVVPLGALLIGGRLFGFGRELTAITAVGRWTGLGRALDAVRAKFLGMGGAAATAGAEIAGAEGATATGAATFAAGSSSTAAAGAAGIAAGGAGRFAGLTTALRGALKAGIIGIGAALAAQLVGGIVGGDIGGRLKKAAPWAGIGGALGFAVGGPMGAAVGALVAGGIKTLIGQGHTFGQHLGDELARGLHDSAVGRVPNVGKDIAAAIDREIKKVKIDPVDLIQLRHGTSPKDLGLDAKQIQALYDAGRAGGQALTKGLNQASRFFRADDLVRTLAPTIKKGLEKLGPQGAQGMLSAIKDWANAMVAAGRLPAGSTKRIIDAMLRQFPQLRAGMGKGGKDAVDALNHQLGDRRLVNTVQKQIDAISGPHGWGFLKQSAKATGDTVYTQWRSTYDGLLRIAHDTAGKHDKYHQQMHDQAIYWIDQLKKDQPGLMQQVEDRFLGQTKDMKDKGSGDYWALTRGAVSALTALGVSTDAALKALHVNPVDFKVDQAIQKSPAFGGFFGASAPTHATGGLLQYGRPGERGPDSLLSVVGGQPIMVAPGEQAMILTADQQAAMNAAWAPIGGLPGFFQRFDRPHGYAKGGAVQAMINEANAITAHHYPYVWGGGHDASFSGPYDCSGAVSAVLHAAGLLGAPMVSGGFMNWGQPGPGPVSIYANAGHVFMSILGKFFGTSNANPGGGADWIPGGRQDSLAGFVARHAPVTGSGDFAAFLKRVLIDGPPGPLRSTAQGSSDTVWHAANKYIFDRFAAQGAVGGGDVGTSQNASGPRHWAGKVSTFGPPGEPAGQTASGVSSALPGIALYDRSAPGGRGPSLGHMFRVAVGAHTGPLKQTDVGPAPSTGRIMDVTGAGSSQIGINPSAFPTDSFGTADMLRRGGLLRFARGGLIPGFAAGGPVKPKPTRAPTRRPKFAKGHKTTTSAKVRKAFRLGYADGILSDPNDWSRFFDDLEAQFGLLGQIDTADTTTADGSAPDPAALTLSSADIGLLSGTFNQAYNGPTKHDRIPVFGVGAGLLDAEMQNRQAKLKGLLDEQGGLAKLTAGLARAAASRTRRKARLTHYLKHRLKQLNQIKRDLADLTAKTLKGRLNTALSRERTTARREAARTSISHIDDVIAANRDAAAAERARGPYANVGYVQHLEAENRGLADQRRSEEHYLASLAPRPGGVAAASAGLLKRELSGREAPIKLDLKELGGSTTSVGTGGEIGRIDKDYGNITQAISAISDQLFRVQTADIPGAKLDIQAIGRRGLTPAAAATAAAVAGPADTDRVTLLEQQLNEARLTNLVLTRQYDVLKGMPPFAGSFAGGGVVPGPPGAARTVIAHGGETITAQDRSAGDTHVYFAPGTEWLRDFVRVEVDRTTRPQARGARRALPGRSSW